MTHQDQASINVTLRQRSNFAVQHLMGAARFSRQCGAAEKEHEGKPYGPFFDELIACVSATIMLSVASLESNINEFLFDIDRILPELENSACEEFCRSLVRTPILEKYQAVLKTKGIETFNRGARPYQDVDLLIDIRNELVHFNPEWHDDQDEHKLLGERIRGKFELSRFISEGNGVIFPQRYVSHGCTKWAVENALDFITQFETKIGIKSRFAKFMDRLET